MDKEKVSEKILKAEKNPTKEKLIELLELLQKELEDSEFVILPTLTRQIFDYKDLYKLFWLTNKAINCVQIEEQYLDILDRSLNFKGIIIARVPDGSFTPEEFVEEFVLYPKDILMILDYLHYYIVRDETGLYIHLKGMPLPPKLRRPELEIWDIMYR
ncbi:MAG: hypothetical protein HY929_06240 [Euryarchaeota archaeon]|nr:hypothetical protein [Euryarchaeota archaeon]